MRIDGVKHNILSVLVLPFHCMSLCHTAFLYISRHLQPRSFGTNKENENLNKKEQSLKTFRLGINRKGFSKREETLGHHETSNYPSPSDKKRHNRCHCFWLPSVPLMLLSSNTSSAQLAWDCRLSSNPCTREIQHSPLGLLYTMCRAMRLQYRCSHKTLLCSNVESWRAVLDHSA